MDDTGVDVGVFLITKQLSVSSLCTERVRLLCPRPT